MSRRRRAKSIPIVVSKKLSKNWYTSNKTIIYRVLGWVLAFSIASFFTYYFQFKKRVEGDAIVTDVRISSDNPLQRVYEINVEINNSGNQTLSLINADPYIRHESDPDKPMPLLDLNKHEVFRDNTIEVGKIKSFSVHAYVDKKFIQDGINDQKIFAKNIKNLPYGKILAVYMGIEIGILIRTADRRFFGATTPRLDIVFMDGQQINYKRQLKPAIFEEIDEQGIDVGINKSRSFLFKEP